MILYFHLKSYDISISYILYRPTPNNNIQVFDSLIISTLYKLNLVLSYILNVCTFLRSAYKSIRSYYIICIYDDLSGCTKNTN